MSKVTRKPSIIELQLSLDIHFQEIPGFRSTTIACLETPLEIWQIIPKKEEFIDKDYNNVAHYQKKISFFFKKREYVFRFYRNVKRERNPNQ